MIRIMLVCSAGMSTSLLVTKMKQAAEKKGIDCKIFAVAESESNQYLDEADVLLLGPQVRYLLGKMEALMKPRGVEVQVIDSISYGTMNGEAVLNQALQMVKG